MDENHVCCICGKEFTGWGNNPYPVDMHPDHKCCNDCNYEFVIPARIDAMYKKEEN